jgi:hypothetical protein
VTGIVNDRLVTIIALTGGFFCLVVVPLLAIWAGRRRK